MSVRVITYTKAWQALELEHLIGELSRVGNSVQTEVSRLRAAAAAANWSLDAHNDPALAELGGKLSRLGEKIRRGERVQYVAVVKDVRVAGRRRIQTLRSFGRADKADASVRAQHFVASYEAAVQVRRNFGLRPLTAPEEDAIRHTFGMILGDRWTSCIVAGGDEIFDSMPANIESFTEEP